jgi:dynein heavy chain
LRSEVVDQLQDYKEKLHENTRLGIKAVIDQLRLQILNEMSNEDDQMNVNQSGGGGQEGGAFGGLADLAGAKEVVDEKKQVLEQLGFPQNMSYGHRSMMRNEFVRFLRLAYLLDFICIQSLGNIYINSAVDFMKRISHVAECTQEGPVLPNYDKFVQE